MTRSLLAIALLLTGAGVYWLTRTPHDSLGLDPSLPVPSTLAPGPGGTGGIGLVMPDDVASRGALPQDVRVAALPTADRLQLAPLRALVIDGHRSEPAPFVTLQVIDRNGVESTVTSDAEGRVRSNDYVASGLGEVRVVEGLGAPVFPNPKEAEPYQAFVGIRDQALLSALRPRYSVSIGTARNQPDEWIIESSRLVPLQLMGLPPNASEVRALFGPTGQGTYEARFLGAVDAIHDARGQRCDLGSPDGSATHLLELRLLSNNELRRMLNGNVRHLSPTQGLRPESEIEGMSDWNAPKAHLPSDQRALAMQARTESSFFVGFRKPRMLPAVWDRPLVIPMHKIVELDPDKVRKDFETRFPIPIAARFFADWNVFQARRNAAVRQEPIAWPGAIEGRVTSQSKSFRRGVEMKLRAVEPPLPAWRDYSAHVKWKVVDGMAIGSYRFNNVPPGEFWLEAKPSGLEESTPHRQPIRVSSSDGLLRAGGVEVQDTEDRRSLRVYVSGGQSHPIKSIDATLAIQIQGAERVVSRLFAPTERDEAGALLITDRLPAGAPFSLILKSPGYMPAELRQTDFEAVEGGYSATLRFTVDPTYRRPMGSLDPDEIEPGNLLPGRRR